MPLLKSLVDKLVGKNRSVRIIVHAPEETPAGEPLFLSGACRELGEWSPAGCALQQTSPGVWEARVSAPTDQPLEFKVTRGSWEKVERHADGSETGNHLVEAGSGASAPIVHTVESWSDVA